MVKVIKASVFGLASAWWAAAAIGWVDPSYPSASTFIAMLGMAGICGWAFVDIMRAK